MSGLKYGDLQVGSYYKNWCGEVRKCLHVLTDTWCPFVMSEYVKGYKCGKDNGEDTGGRCFDLYDLNVCEYKKFDISTKNKE